MQYSSPAMATGKTDFLKNSLMASVLVIGGTSIPVSIIQIKSDRARGLEKSGKAHNPRYSSSLLRCLCGSASLGFSSRASTFWRRCRTPVPPLGFSIFRLQGGLPGGELVHLGPEPLGGGQGYGIQAFQLPCRRLKQNDLPLMPPEEFLLVPGLAVLVIQGTELAIGGGVLHSEGQPLHLLLRCPEVRLYPGGGGRRPVAPLGQFLIAGDPMFSQEVQRFRRPLQILDSRPMLVAGALLGFEIVLDVDEQAGLPGALLRLAGGAGPSGHLGGQGLLGIIGARVFNRVNRSWPGALADMYLPRFSSYPSR